MIRNRCNNLWVDQGIHTKNGGKTYASCAKNGEKTYASSCAFAHNAV